MTSGVLSVPEARSPLQGASSQTAHQESDPGVVRAISTRLLLKNELPLADQAPAPFHLSSIVLWVRGTWLPRWRRRLEMTRWFGRRRAGGDRGGDR